MFARDRQPEYVLKVVGVGRRFRGADIQERLFCRGFVGENLVIHRNIGTITFPEVPLLLYDGTCGFCAKSVQFVLRTERRRTDMVFATLQGPYGDLVRKSFPGTTMADSVLLYEPPLKARPAIVRMRSDAALAVASYLGGPWKLLAAIGSVFPRFLRDRAYDLVARHRHRIAGAEACLVPTPAQRGRFLDP